MSRNVPAAIQAALDSGAMALATCVKITTTGGTVYGFTDWQVDLVVDLVTYKSIGGYTAQAIRTTSEMNVDNVDLIGYFVDSGITLDAVRNGFLDNAAVEKFKVNPRSLPDGIIKLRAGTLGRQQAGDNDFNFEIRGLFQRLQQTVGKVLTPRCRAELFDAECKVPEYPPDWSASTAVTAVDAYDAGVGSFVRPTAGFNYFYRCTIGGTTNDTEGEPTWNTTPGGTTVEADGVEWETVLAWHLKGAIATSPITSRAIFASGSLSVQPDGFWEHGVVTFTSGLNAGVSREVKSFTATGNILEFFLPFPYDVSVFDFFDITAGCLKDLPTCRDTYRNTYNRRAEDYVPGLDKANEVPKVK